MTNNTVGIIGLGIMGSAIARNLVERGWTVVGFDIDQERGAEALRNQVIVVDSIGELTERVPVIMTSLPSAAAANTVAQEIADLSQPQKVVIELSTLKVSDKIQFHDILTKSGHLALDCPLSGTGAQAKMRDLIIYASGDSDAIANCSRLFADFAKQSADLGVYGNGSKMKFIANHLVAIHNVAAAEAMVLAECAGLDLAQVVGLIGPGAGGSRMFQMRAPMMAKRVYEPATMRVSTWKKDMAIIAEFADALDCETPLFNLTQPVYADAMSMGLGDQDTAAVFEVLRKANAEY